MFDEGYFTERLTQMLISWYPIFGKPIFFGNQNSLILQIFGQHHQKLEI